MDFERIVVPCWHCRGRLRLPVGKVGRTLCPHCGRNFWVDTRRGGGRWRTIEARLRNDGATWLRWSLLVVLVIWLPYVAGASSLWLIESVCAGALISALAVKLLEPLHSGRVFQELLKMARLYFWSLAGVAAAFSVLLLRLGTKVRHISDQSTMKELSDYYYSNERWSLGWIDPDASRRTFLALASLAAVASLPLAGKFARKLWVRVPVALLAAFALCALISDATIQFRTADVNLALEETARDYFLLRRDLANELAARLLKERSREDNTEALKRLVQETLDRSAMPSVKKVMEFQASADLRPAAALPTAPAQDARSAALTEVLQDRPEDATAALKPIAVGKNMISEADLQGFSVAPFYIRYHDYAAGWQQTRETIASLDKQRDDLQIIFHSMARSDVPDTVSLASIARGQAALRQWYPANPAPKDEVSAVVAQAVDAGCNQALAVSLSAFLSDRNQDFLSDQARAWVNSLCAQANGPFLQAACAQLIANPRRETMEHALDGYVRSKPVRDMMNRLNAMPVGVRGDCDVAKKAAQIIDSEIDAKLKREMPSYVRGFETLARSQLWLPFDKVKPAICEAILQQLEARLESQENVEARFRLLCDWAGEIAKQPNRATAERYAFFTQFESNILHTNTLQQAVSSAAEAQERGAKWGAFRQELERDLAAGKAVLPTGQDEPLQKLLDRWDADRPRFLPEVYLTGNGDWEVEFASELSDTRQAVAWGEAIILSTNRFAQEIRSALELRGQWLQTNDPSLASAEANVRDLGTYHLDTEDFQKLPLMPEDGYFAYISTVHPYAGHAMTPLSRVDLNEQAGEDGYFNSKATEAGCVLWVYHEVGFQKMVVARYPIRCPAEFVR